MSPTKGEQTRAAILDEALKIASKLGLEGLTIGSLADATGMSKSGLFAHFGSREDLQLAVLDHAAQLYGEKVFVPVLKIERGLPRLRALRALARLGARIRPAWRLHHDLGRDRIRRPPGPDPRRGDRQPASRQRHHQEGGAPRDRGRAPRPGTDPEQISFEMLGIVLAGHNHRRLLGDKEARKRALTAFEELISRHAAPARSRAA